MYEITNWGLCFYISNLSQDRHFRWSSKPREGLAICSEKGVPSFLSYFKTLSTGPALGIEPTTSRSAVSHFRYWATICNPAYKYSEDHSWNHLFSFLTDLQNKQQKS